MASLHFWDHVNPAWLNKPNFRLDSVEVCNKKWQKCRNNHYDILYGVLRDYATISRSVVANNTGGKNKVEVIFDHV